MFCRRITVGILTFAAALSAATVEHFAGGGTAEAGASAKEIRFIEPFGIAFDQARNAYVIEFMGNRLVKIDPAGKTSLFAGNGKSGFAGDGANASGAQFFEPHGVVINHEEQIFIADTHNNRVRRIDLKSGIISTVAGNGQKSYSGDNGPATQAAFNGIFAIDLSPKGDRLYIADLTNRRVRLVNLKSGVVTTVAGNGEKGVPTDGAMAAQSPLVDPRAVTADSKGNVYVLERGGNALRVVDAKGRIRTLIKPGDIQPDMKGPKHLSMDRNGDVIIADAENHLVRRYSVKTRKTTTIAGTGKPGNHIDPTDPLKTELNRPHGVFVHPDGTLYITDSYNHRILKVKGF
ncbi:MAG: hypothetical protein IT168_27245 [Bryobacterales bacterium]|nr:hypothetical protein [Bryobacterales bacterium]